MKFNNPQFSFGWELEATHGVNEIPEGVACGTDGSVHGDGLEYRLRERYVDDPMAGIKFLRELTSDRRLEVDDSCGFHVHLGLKHFPRMPADYSHLWAAWCVTLGKQVEEMAFQAVPDSRNDNSYCRKWKGVNLRSGLIDQTYHRAKGDNEHRYQWINPVEIFRSHGIRTVEFRLMGESKKFTYLLAWVSFCFLLGTSAFYLIQDPSLIDREADMLNVWLAKIRDFVKKGTPAQAAKTTKAIASVAALMSSSFSRFSEFAENESYIQAESFVNRLSRLMATDQQLATPPPVGRPPSTPVAVRSNADWRREFHALRRMPSGNLRRPRTPVQGCGCIQCIAYRQSISTSSTMRAEIQNLRNMQLDSANYPLRSGSIANTGNILADQNNILIDEEPNARGAR